VRTADGCVVMRYLGKVEEVVRIPGGPYRYSFTPARAWCSDRLDDLFAGMPGIDQASVRVSHPEGAGVLAHRFWNRIVAGMMLSRREQAHHKGLGLLPVPGAGWLLARMAAKDAARLLAGLEHRMPDVEILPDAHGRPIVTLADGTGPHVSLAHKGLVAVAAAAQRGACDGIGIDLEPLGPLDPGVAADAFDREEAGLLETAARAAALPDDHARLMAWTVKEAIGKAFGRGLPGGPRDLRLTFFDARAGRAAAVVAGRLLEAFPGRAGRPIDASFRTWRGHAVALCLSATRPLGQETAG
jgi:phosphopantetheinyl transferase (holo-ACP synthase)